jgi:hypothetical protein
LIFCLVFLDLIEYNTIANATNTIPPITPPTTAPIFAADLVPEYSIMRKNETWLIASGRPSWFSMESWWTLRAE